jgi:(p)ppGpp synthase/HD superfamily hydrolase
MLKYHKALIRATVAHKDQKRKFSGLPYIIHPMRVAMRVIEKLDGRFTHEYMEHAAIVAIFHDTVEDGHITLDELTNEFGPSVAMDIKLLTRQKEEKYEDFIERLTVNPVAVLVKICDLEDNMSDLPENHGLFNRYRPAHEKLTKLAKGWIL